MPSEMYIVIAVISTIVIVGNIINITVFFAHKRYENFVLQNSICLKKIKEINSRYNFYPYKNFDQYYTYDNENFYDNITCKDYLVYQLQFIGKSLSEQIEKIRINKEQYSKYVDEVNSITQLGEFEVSVGKLKLKKLIKKELLLIEKFKFRFPVTQFFLTVTLYCSKIDGQVYKQKSQEFSADDIFAINRKLSNKSGSFYNDREIWDAICLVERGKVSNKMRFSIYQRDGYRCRLCGVSDKFTKLEIDHIVPIAKGGKSTYDNLQTLCHKCNTEKGDSL